MAILVSFLAAMIISAIFAWLSLRLEPDGLGVMSIAMHLAILAIVLNWTSLTRGALGIPQIPRLPILTSLPSIAITMSIIAVLWILLMLWIDRSAFGRQLAALAEHEWYAKSLGINKIKLIE